MFIATDYVAGLYAALDASKGWPAGLTTAALSLDVGARMGSKRP